VAVKLLKERRKRFADAPLGIFSRHRPQLTVGPPKQRLSENVA
jgi:hypothetical protein